MGEYATKNTDDDGDHWLASDGKRYATRSGAWKWSKKISKSKEEPKPEPEPAPAPAPAPEPEITAGPDWTTFDYESEDGPTEVVPALLKRIKPSGAPGSKKSKKQMEAETQTSIAVLGVVYRTSDHILTRYKRAVMRDKEAEAITHSDSDIEWISGVTNDGLAHSGVHIASMMSPMHLAVACNAYWFGRPLLEIQTKKKSGSLGVGSLMERLPFLGARLKARRMAREAESDEQELVERPLQA